MSTHVLSSGSSTPRGGSYAWRLLRVTWRQHRVSLVSVAVLLTAFAAFLVAQGIGMHSAYQALGLSYSHPPTTAHGGLLATTFENEYLGIGMYLPRFLMFLPLVIGAFVGAPLIARELETGTFRFAWTQSVGRTRWAIAKLVILSLALTVMALSFSAIFAWWYRPFEQLLGRATEVEGLVFAARMLFGFALGAFVGALVRRTVPAIAATMGLWLGVVVPTALFLRPHFEAPLTGPVNMAAKFGPEWTLSQWWVGPNGHRLTTAAYNTLVRALPTSHPELWLTKHHYVLWESYQPANRFWTFQIIEASGLCLLAVVLIGLTLWWVRRRAT
jgi:ABC-type transport system involved in multi-copper enzyme maturation permease subunit